MPSLRVACVQVGIVERSREETLRHVLDLLEQARGCDLILLPEMWPWGFFAYDRYASGAEALNGPTVAALGEKARALKAWVLMGSFVEQDGQILYNTSVLLDAQGRVAGRYRKVHLFSYRSEESRLLCPGRDVVVVPTPWGRVGLSICYDLRFPELYRRMVDDGVEIFLVSSAWPSARLESWRLFTRARAHENLAYLFASNCAGVQRGQPFAGHSLVVDPRGQVLAEGGEAECLVAVDIDPGLVAQVRQDFPALHDRVFR